MTTRELNHSPAAGPLECESATPAATQRELRIKARTLRALAQSALATGTPDATAREYLTAVLAFAGMYVGD